MMSPFSLAFASGETSLSPVQISAREALSQPFEILVTARSPRDDIAITTLVGQPTSLRAESAQGSRVWTGVCRAAQLVDVDLDGPSTYEITLVPALWLLSQRRNHRVFQSASVPGIVRAIVSEWRLAADFRIDEAAHPVFAQRVQHGESDLDFVRRLLEEAGISFFFEHDAEKGSILVLTDRPQGALPRLAAPVPFLADAGAAQAGGEPYATAVELGRAVAPERLVLRDFDFRRPGFPLFAESADRDSSDAGYEEYEYLPGGFEIETKPPAGGATLVGDDKGAFRADPRAGQDLAQRALRSRRARARTVAFETNQIELSPGAVFAISGHSHPDLGMPLLVTAFSLEAELDRDWILEGKAVFADRTYRPPRTIPRPTVAGVEGAVVIGPDGKDIHVDEHGRVRVRLHWDRWSRTGDEGSCWARVSQAWAGPGYGLDAAPRVGHEVIIAYVGGDPDQPMVVGRLHHGLAPPPESLPDAMAASLWRGSSTPGGGGGNEILLDDRKGAEQLRFRAARDFGRLVKRDEALVAGKDLTRVTGNDEVHVTGGDRTRVTGHRDIDIGEQNRRITVGQDRHAIVGEKNLVWVGHKYVARIVPRLAEVVPREIERAADALVGGALAGSAEGAMGPIVSRTRAAGVELEGPLDALASTAPAELKAINKRVRLAAPQDASTMLAEDGPTRLMLTDHDITLATSGASLTLQRGTVRLRADGRIYVVAGRDIVSSHKIEVGAEGLSPAAADGDLEATEAPTAALPEKPTPSDDFFGAPAEAPAAALPENPTTPDDFFGPGA